MVDGKKRPPLTEEQRARKNARAKEYRERNAERIAASQKEYRARNAEQIAEYKKTWRAENSERIATYRKAYHERRAAEDPTYRAQRSEYERERMARHAAEAAALAERRRKNSERAKRWAAENPEKAKAKRERWARENPERTREHKRAYYARHREELAERVGRQRLADPVGTRAKDRARRATPAAAEKHRTANKAWLEKPGNYEKALAYNREWKRRERARIKAGLPPRKMRRPTKLEKTDNARAADAFFARTWTRKEIDWILDRAAIDLRRSPRANYEPIPAAELQQWRLQSAVARARFEHRSTPEQRANAVQIYLRKHGARLTEEVRMDSRARELEGAAPYDVPAEVGRRAAATVESDEQRRIATAVKRAMASYATPASAAATAEPPSSSPSALDSRARTHRPDRAR